MENIIYSPSGNVSIRINEDKMSAWMYIHRSDKIINEREILNLIDDAGICNGFEDAIQWMSENGYNKDYDKPFPVAICKTATQNETVNYQFDTAKTYLPDKDWSFRDVQTWPYVEAGTPLANVAFNLFSEGASIYNVFGELATNLASSLSLAEYAGENVSLDTENKQLVAAEDGFPYLDGDGRVHIAHDLVYKGDIKLTKIPLNLPTSLVIEGSINKAHITVMKDLTIKGNVISAEIYCEGNLDITGEIIECQTTGVIAQGDMHCGSITDSLVLTRGQLAFDNIVKGSRVVAEKKISGNPETSRICSSQVFSAGSIDVADLGDEEYNETEAEITISPFLKERISQLKNSISKMEENFDINSDRIDQAYKKLRNLEHTLAEEMKAYFENENELPRYIRVRNLAFKGAYIRVLNKSFQIKQTSSDIEYLAD